MVARTSRPRDVFYDMFAAAYESNRFYGVPYIKQEHDFPQLRRLQHAMNLTREDWTRAVENYLSTPHAYHTLAFLASHFATFQKCALDRYEKPLKKPGGGPMSKTAGSIAWQIRFLQRANKLWDSDKGKRDAIMALYDQIETDQLDEAEATKQLQAIETGERG